MTPATNRTQYPVAVKFTTATEQSPFRWTTAYNESDARRKVRDIFQEHDQPVIVTAEHFFEWSTRQCSCGAVIGGESTEQGAEFWRHLKSEGLSAW